MLHARASVCEEVKRKCAAVNTMVQLSAPTPTLSATMHCVTDGQTDDSMMPIEDHTVQSAKMV